MEKRRMTFANRVKPMRESLALLKILDFSNKSIEKGKVKPVRAAFSAIRRRLGK